MNPFVNLNKMPISTLVAYKSRHQLRCNELVSWAYFVEKVALKVIIVAASVSQMIWEIVL